ncbi:hypothetical protein Csac_1388 [Caldicellulosiruptor saccharolyticus DSM 8903]|uniref:Transposase (putative) YhgA-like domain-containing protein n=1 Tax=Caldicellulosiruptor saccharolyticus (strain ATCC 43494 / DSM 8903 / Tp8T 6331) TaxID=351627 RepID=A4XJA5_CALS8|nr:Rpn family recombination-promoting nuclease/putative transposase [Caldicellulosiruptor saccharolyticus]ABP66990.1 hypothetical protein Csac_1388 [Caldicellulosiruptor saccharolyticus DSM 8903]
MSKKRRSKDVGFKKIFTNKTNIHWFITEFLGNFLPCKIGLDDIEMLATESINSQWKARRSDVVYKIKYKDAFVCILLEFQNTKEELFHCRIYEYVLLIQKKYAIEDLLPVVIPVVLYTGQERWTPTTSFEKGILYWKDFEQFAQKFNFIFIDIKEIDDEKLLNGSNLLSAALYIDKVSENPIEVAERLEYLSKHIKFSEEQKEEFCEWLYHVVLKGYGFTDMEVDEFVFKSDFLRLGVNEMFLNTAEKIREGLKKELAKEREVAIKEGIQQGIQQGKEQALIEVAQRMIAEGAEDSFITKVTGLSIEKVQELRNNLK